MSRWCQCEPQNRGPWGPGIGIARIGVGDVEIPCPRGAAGPDQGRFLPGHRVVGVRVGGVLKAQLAFRDGCGRVHVGVRHQLGGEVLSATGHMAEAVSGRRGSATGCVLPGYPGCLGGISRKDLAIGSHGDFNRSVGSAESDDAALPGADTFDNLGGVGDVAQSNLRSCDGVRIIGIADMALDINVGWLVNPGVIMRRQCQVRDLLAAVGYISPVVPDQATRLPSVDEGTFFTWASLVTLPRPT